MQVDNDFALPGNMGGLGQADVPDQIKYLQPVLTNLCPQPPNNEPNANAPNPWHFLLKNAGGYDGEAQIACASFNKSLIM